MRSAIKAIQAAAGNAGEAVYVDDVFSTYVYAGNSSTNQIDNGIDLAGEGGLIWLKKRSAGTTGADHSLIDTERGRLVRLKSNKSDAELSFDQLDSFNSDGFTLSGSGEKANLSGKDYVSWTFRKQPGFFDVVTYSGTGSAQNISHNLGSVPGMIAVKRTSGVEDWIVYHRSTGNDKGTGLNQTNATFTSTAYWNSTTPTDSVFTVGTHDRVNTSGHDYVAYIFAHDAQDFGTDSDESIIKCGTYTGNGTSAGLEVDLGFEPQWLLVKTASGSGDHKNWWLLDNMRGIRTGETEYLLAANLSDAETTNANIYDLTATGFIAKNSTQANQNGMNYIYVAIRRPHKPAEEFAATDLFAVDGDRSGGNTAGAYSAGFPVDMALQRIEDGADSTDLAVRLMSRRRLITNDNDGAVGDNDLDFDYQSGWGAFSTGSSSFVSWMFRRAPGFFDVVTYGGTGGSVTTEHNLGVTPELMILKTVSSSTGWLVWSDAYSATHYMMLNATQTPSSDSGAFNNTAPTATHFTAGTFANADENLALLFASVPGISKVGSYSGTGSDITIDCGFSSGARFVLIKSTTYSGGWYFWDSVRGITTGNDPYLRLNVGNAQATTSLIDVEPDSSGFIVNGGNANTNTSGNDYIFLAIA